MMVEDLTLRAPGASLVSFDIDGTLEVGDPPGPITLLLVRRIQQRGHRIGSCSDRTLAEQREIWRSAEIEVDFVTRKHQLQTLRDEFNCVNFVHIGDTTTDSEYALAAGFKFWYAADLPLANPELVILRDDRLRTNTQNVTALSSSCSSPR